MTGRTLDSTSTSKVCKICLREKTLDEFGVNKLGKYGRRTMCKVCRQASISEEQRQAAKENSRLWRETNPEKSREAARRWRKENPEAARAQNRSGKQRYKARKKRNFVFRVRYRDVFVRDSGVCYLCDKPVSYELAQFDHLIPISRKGCHAPENVAVSCQPCNTQKSDKLPTELPIEQGLRVLQKLKAIQCGVYCF